MIFRFGEREYQIRFEREPSRNLVDHWGHEIEIRRRASQGVKEGFMSGDPQPHDEFEEIPPWTAAGPALLFCVNCEVETGNSLQLTGLPKKQMQIRRTVCRIMRGSHKPGEKPQAWEEYAVGESKPNRKAGDEFTKEGGRVAALDNAFKDKRLADAPSEILREFCNAARSAYWGRKPQAAAGAVLR